MSNRTCSRRLVALVTALAGAALDATVARADFDIVVTLAPSVQVFAPAEPTYILGVGVTATGFVDESNLNNFVSLRSSDGLFLGDLYPARGTGSGMGGSAVFSTAAALADAINTPMEWILTVVDGVTEQTSMYTVVVYTFGIPDEYVRPITLDIEPNTSIASQPTVNIMQDPTGNPFAEYTTAFAFYLGLSPGNFATEPPLGPMDTSWTPAAPLNDDVYTLLVQRKNEFPDQSLVIVEPPIPFGPAVEIESFTVLIEAVSSSEVSGLRVGEPGTFDVTVTMSPAVLSFSPAEPPIYILGVGLDATGFADEANLNNFIELRSPDGSFTGDFYPARNNGSGTAGSVGTSSVTELSALINAPGDWLLSITDGATAQTSEYTLTVSTPGIAPDFVRPITLDLLPGAEIEPNQTFTFSQLPSPLPEAQYDTAFVALFGTAHAYFSPGITPSDTSWTPDVPIESDSYTFFVLTINNNSPQSLMQIGFPVAVDGALALNSFVSRVSCQASAQVGNITVVAGCRLDFNNDGILSPDDLDEFITTYFSEAPDNAPADFNNDGIVSPDDLDEFITGYFEGC